MDRSNANKDCEHSAVIRRPRLALYGAHRSRSGRGLAALAACKALGNPLPKLAAGAVVLYVRKKPCGVAF